MMLKPSYTDLMEVVNSGVEEGADPIIQSRYSIVIATAKRARQLIAKEDPSIASASRKPLSVAPRTTSSFKETGRLMASCREMAFLL